MPTMKSSPNPLVASIVSLGPAADSLATTAPEKAASMPSCQMIDAKFAPVGSSFAINAKGSIQPRRVVNFPGTCTRGDVLIHGSAVPVGSPNVNGGRRLLMTV